MRRRRIVLHPYLEADLIAQIHEAVGEPIPAGEAGGAKGGGGGGGGGGDDDDDTRQRTCGFELPLYLSYRPQSSATYQRQRTHTRVTLQTVNIKFRSIPHPQTQARDERRTRAQLRQENAAHETHDARACSEAGRPAHHERTMNLP